MLDVININACAKFSPIPFTNSQDIEWKRNSDVIQGTLFCNELMKMDVININAFILKILSRNKILSSFKGRNSVTN